MQALIDLFFPPKCPFCDSFQQKPVICPNCLKSLNFLDSKFTAPHLDKKWFNDAYSVLAYEGQAIEVIKNLKYKRQFNLVRILANHLADQMLKMENYDLIVPVPLHWQRLISRGYNQAGLLAKALAKKTQVKCDLSTLKRNKNVVPQVGLGRKERLKNMLQAFSLRPKGVSKLKEKSILIIDDVMTTGATVNECAKVLVKNGKCGKVDVLTVARTL